MSNAFLYRMPSGIPGDVSRKLESTVESQLFDSAHPFSAYGLFGKLANGKFIPMGAGDTADSVYGLLVRPYPTHSSQEPLGVATPPTSGVANVMRRGYMSVKNNAGNPTNGSQVYVRVANAASGKPLGGIEAVADGTNTIAIKGCIFTNAGDANGQIEIAFNI